MSLVDFVAIAPFWIELVFGGQISLGVLRMLRMMRMMRMLRMLRLLRMMRTMRMMRGLWVMRSSTPMRSQHLCAMSCELPQSLGTCGLTTATIVCYSE